MDSISGMTDKAQNQGWVAFPRALLKQAVWLDAELFKLFMLIFINANYKETDILVDGIKEPIHINRGQLLIGRYALHSMYYPSKRKNQKHPTTLWRWLKKLEKMQLLGAEMRSQYTILTVCHYDDYISGSVPECADRAQTMRTNNNDIYKKNKPALPFEEAGGQANTNPSNPSEYERAKAKMDQERKSYVKRHRTKDTEVPHEKQNVG